ncbi:MAG TPA: VOC family protein [Thermoanaerobaculia bacterium]
MRNDVNPIPNGYTAPVPSLVVDGAAAAIDFYTKAFGAKENGRMAGPDGKIVHADLSIGEGHIMLADPMMGAKSPKALGGTPVTICIYVENSDKVVERAVSSGASVLRPVQNEFWGDRAGQVRDPFGHIWYVLTRVEDLSKISPEEMRKRGEAFFQAETVRA